MEISICHVSVHADARIADDIKGRPDIAKELLRQVGELCWASLFVDGYVLK